MIPHSPRPTLFPYTTLFRSNFSPVYLAPSSTVLPTPFAVSGTPLPRSPCPIFFAPDSTSWVAPFTLLSSAATAGPAASSAPRSEEHTSELQSLRHLVCRLLL